MPLPNCLWCNTSHACVKAQGLKGFVCDEYCSRAIINHHYLEDLKAMNRAKHETIVALKNENEELKTSLEFWYGQLTEAIKFNEEGLRN